MGFFTKDQIDEIRGKVLDKHAIKDSEFVPASALNGNEEVAILQDGQNKRTSLGELKNGVCRLTVTCQLTGSEIKINGITQSVVDAIRGTAITVEVSAPGYITYQATFPVMLTQTMRVFLLPQAQSDYLAVRWDYGDLPATQGDYDLYVDSNVEWEIID